MERVGRKLRTGNPDHPKSIPERVPAKFNSRSQLKADVEPGNTVLDFHLDSK